MVNLRRLAEQDLETTLEGEWGLPVILIDPEGNVISKKTGTLNDLTGQILYDTVKHDLDTGLPVVVNHPVVTVRRSSLSRVPKAGEKWLVRIPVSPVEGAVWTSAYLSLLYSH